MIYSTNRTASLGEVAVDVNESYFGAGALSFMQENAQDELALFESAIKSDIDEVLIGESAAELEALNESFVENAANKIAAMMKKFIEWLRSVLRSAVAKMSQILVRDNGKFCKVARKQIAHTPNTFKYTGKGLVFGNISNTENSNKPDSSALYARAEKAASKAEIEKIEAELREAEEEFDKNNLRTKFNEDCVESVEGKDLSYVEKHLTLLEGLDKKSLGDLRKEMKKMESEAKKLANDAKRAAKEYKGEDEIKKNRLALMAKVAASYRNMCQKYVQDMLYIIKQQSKIARSVVAKAMGGAKNEGAEEYSEELSAALLETHEYALDEALEEMTEAEDCGVSEDDIEDEE